MTNSLRPHGPHRAPLPPAQSSADGVPSPRSPQNQQNRPANERSRAAGRPGAQRDSFFDNAKYLAIVLVAIGHAWEPLKGDSRILAGVYTVVYTFHMPAFIIISGSSRAVSTRAPTGSSG